MSDTVILVQSAVNPNLEPVRSNAFKIGLVNLLLKPRIGLIGWCGTLTQRRLWHPRPAAFTSNLRLQNFLPFPRPPLFQSSSAIASSSVSKRSRLAILSQTLTTSATSARAPTRASPLTPQTPSSPLLQSLDNSTIGRSRSTFARRRNKKQRDAKHQAVGKKRGTYYLAATSATIIAINKPKYFFVPTS